MDSQQSPFIIPLDCSTILYICKVFTLLHTDYCLLSKCCGVSMRNEEYRYSPHKYYINGSWKVFADGIHMVPFSCPQISSSFAISHLSGPLTHPQSSPRHLSNQFRSLAADQPGFSKALILRFERKHCPFHIPRIAYAYASPAISTLVGRTCSCTCGNHKITRV